MIRIRHVLVIATLALSATACETDGGYYAAPRLGPGYVEIAENQRFGVSYRPDLNAALLTYTLIGSFAEGGEERAPPTEAQWRDAAVAAMPEGCALARLEREAEDAYRAFYDCP